MENLFDYVKKYGDTPFEKLEFNDIDNLVFSTLIYLDYTNTTINSKKQTLEKIGKYILKTNSYKKIPRSCIAQRNAYNLLELVIEKKRYKNILLSDYVYLTNKEMQFGAVTFEIPNYLNVISFEGTDSLISGWKEDLYIASIFPIPSHIEAIKYVNKHISLFGPKTVICGHSKGGNLALVAGMFMKFYKKFKVIKIYNNDGPGLRPHEFNTRKYKKIKSKYTHIIPNNSMIGVLMYNDLYSVVESSKKGMLAHDMTTWKLNNTTFKSSELSKRSKMIEKNIINFISSHKDKELLITTDKLFKVLEDENISDTIKLNKITSIIKVSHKIVHMDKETRKIIIDLIFYMYNLQREK